jgi:hypothetical protein
MAGRSTRSFPFGGGWLTVRRKIGTLAFDNPEVHFIPMLNSTGYANISSSTLRDHVITFDHKNGLIAFR